MFSSQGSSPFKSSQPQFAPPQPQQQPPQGFAQQQSSYPSYPSLNAPNLNSQSFAGSQYGGNSWGVGASPGGQAPAYGQFAGGYGGQQQQQFGDGMQGVGGSGGTANFGEKAKKNYLPGYLSNGAMGQSEATPPQNNGDDSRTWDSPVRRSSISGSPASRFGSQSLFGGRDGTPSRSPKANTYGRESVRGAAGGGAMYRAEMEEDAPPISSLGEFDGSDSMAFHAEPSHNPSPSADSHPPTFASTHTSSPEGYPVYVFGFPSSALDLVLEYFTQFGDIVSRTPSTEGGNWVTIAFAQPWSAARAARKNGEVLGGVLMVGVKVVDEDQLKRGMAGSDAAGESLDSRSSTPASPPTTRSPIISSSSSGLGKPIPVFGPGSAFKAAAPTPPRRGFFGVGTPESSTAPKGDPHASLFAEKSRQAVMLQQGQEQKGVLGKVSDAIFGW